MEEEEEVDWGELENASDYPFSVPDSKDNIILDVGAFASLFLTLLQLFGL